MLLARRNLSSTVLKRSKSTNHDLYSSFRTWRQEILNYDDMDGHLQDEVVKFALPYYHRNLLVDSKREEPNAYNVKTRLRGPTPASIVDIAGESNEQWFLNEIRCEKYPAGAAHGKRHVVMLHGYAASSVWWCRNIFEMMDRAVVDKSSLHIHSIDMLGFGMSGRPNVVYPHESKIYKQLPLTASHVQVGKDPVCKGCGGRVDGRKDESTWCKCGLPRITVNARDVLNHLPNQQALVQEVEEVYVESLEQWRIANEIDNFDIVSHSLGAYMSVAYAMKYPHRVNKLVLTSPGGMERSPFAVTNPAYSELAGQVKMGGPIPTDIVSKISNSPDSYNFLGRFFKTDKTFKKCWDWNVSLFGIIRWMGPLGPKAIYDFFEPKLMRTNAIRSSEELDAFIKYMYSTYIRESFSETSINRIFESTIVGKVPILDKLEALSKDQLKDTLWLFGQYDMMYPKTGEMARDILLGQGKMSKFKLVPAAGHNVAMDNDAEFNDQVIKYLKL